MSRNFGTPASFRPKKETENIDWAELRERARPGLKRMSNKVANSMILPNRRAGMTLIKRRK